MHNVEIEEV